MLNKLARRLFGFPPLPIISNDEKHILAKAVNTLIDVGLDEDAHFWDNDWHDINLTHLDLMVNDDVIFDDVVERAKPELRQLLRRALDERLKNH
jgi:hypothetical protein